VGSAERSFTTEVQEISPAGGLGVSPKPINPPRLGEPEGVERRFIDNHTLMYLALEGKAGAKYSPVIFLHKRRIQILGGQAKWN
jgi:hypothetical protein